MTDNSQIAKELSTLNNRIHIMNTLLLDISRTLKELTKVVNE